MAVRYDVTSVEHILAFYVETLPEVIRWARRWGAADDAEDVVHQIVLAMLQRREYLRYPPDRPYLFKAVRTQTLKLKVSGYRRFIVTMPWDSLRAVEEINEQARHGKVLP